jgi:hypothetical protein
MHLVDEVAKESQLYELVYNRNGNHDPLTELLTARVRFVLHKRGTHISQLLGEKGASKTWKVCRTRLRLCQKKQAVYCGFNEFLTSVGKDFSIVAKIERETCSWIAKRSDSDKLFSDEARNAGAVAFPEPWTGAPGWDFGFRFRRFAAFARGGRLGSTTGFVVEAPEDVGVVGPVVVEELRERLM